MPDDHDYQDDAYETRFDGYRRVTLDDLVDLGLAVYDHRQGGWVVQGASGPFLVRDVDAPGPRPAADTGGPPLDALIDRTIVRFDDGLGLPPDSPLEAIVFRALSSADSHAGDGTTTNWRNDLLRELKQSGPQAWYEITYATRPGGLPRQPVRAFDEEGALRAAQRMSAAGEQVDVTLVAVDGSRRPAGSFLSRQLLPGSRGPAAEPWQPPVTPQPAWIPAAAQAVRPPVRLPPGDPRGTQRQFPDGIFPLPVTATSGGPLRAARLLHADGAPVDYRPMADSPLEPAVAAGAVPAAGDLAPGWLQVIQRGNGQFIAVHPAQIRPRGVNPLGWLPYRQQVRCAEFDGAEAAGGDSALLQATFVDQGDRIRAAGGEIREVTARTHLGTDTVTITTAGPGGDQQPADYQSTHTVEVMIPARHPAEGSPDAAQLFAVTPAEPSTRAAPGPAAGPPDRQAGRDTRPQAELAGLEATLDWIRRDGSPGTAAPQPGRDPSSGGPAPPAPPATGPEQAGWQVSVAMTGKLQRAQDPAAAAISGLRQNPAWLRLRALTSNARRLAADASAGRLQFTDPAWAMRTWRAVWARTCELTCDLAARTMTDWLRRPERHSKGSRAWQAARNLHHAAAEGTAHAHGWLPRDVRLPAGSYEPPGGRRMTAGPARAKAYVASRRHQAGTGPLSQIDFPGPLAAVTPRGASGRGQQRAARPPAAAPPAAGSPRPGPG